MYAVVIYVVILVTGYVCAFQQACQSLKRARRLLTSARPVNYESDIKALDVLSEELAEKLKQKKVGVCVLVIHRSITLICWDRTMASGFRIINN